MERQSAKGVWGAGTCASKHATRHLDIRHEFGRGIGIEAQMREAGSLQRMKRQLSLEGKVIEPSDVCVVLLLCERTK